MRKFFLVVLVFLLSEMCFLGGILSVSPVYANTINKVDIHVTIHNDGSATLEELWDITMTNASNTEFYVARHNLDNMVIRDLTVIETMADGETVVFETVSSWDLNASRGQKANKCGLMPAKGGYEICWGFGELGSHKYTVTYTITNLVKSYENGDAMGFKFLSDVDNGANQVNIYLTGDEFTMEYPETRVWVYGYNALSGFADGGVEILGKGPFRDSDYASVLLVFETGLLSPIIRIPQHIDDYIEDAHQGSLWGQDAKNTTNPLSKIGAIFGVVFAGLISAVSAVLISIGVSWSAKGSKMESQRQSRLTQLCKNPDYCRELPFQGDLSMSYACLHKIGKVKESAIFGCFLLKWIESRQIELMTQEKGMVFKKDEPCIRMNATDGNMAPLERQLYDLFVAAAGKDGILRNKEFEKYARKKYATIHLWLGNYRKAGESGLSLMGFYTKTQVPYFFEKFKRTITHETPLGEELIGKAMGFKRYLEDFTIINEREAREVELWDQYLIFAELFGIADRVAEQFKKLYPDYFVHQDASSNNDLFTAMAITHVFSNSMYSGYSSGYSAAQSGGGGFSSSGGGGGGFSGGGGAGGR
ncbi:MAG: DUF2207 domain-containing protein [Peptococcaceae bacterium]|nr:DUF2207 domain-containing protein [Peptococcaceae bacterium]